MAESRQPSRERHGKNSAKQPRVLAAIGMALILAACVYFAAGLLEDPPGPEVRGTVQEEPPLLWRENYYKRKNRLTSILFIGVDKEAITESTAGRQGGQADFLFLLLIDDEADTVVPLHIDRDTVGTFAVTNIMGKPAGTATGQISLAYGFGATPAQSCRWTAQAVSDILDGARIDHYLAMGRNAVAALNDAAGGVRLTIDEDMSAVDPSWVPGADVVLTGDQAEEFVRARRLVGAGANEQRMARQEAYLNALRDTAVQGMDAGGEQYLEGLLRALEGCSVKDMSGDFLLDLLFKARKYTWKDAVTLAGEHTVNQRGFSEFYPSRDSIEQTIIDLYYTPSEAHSAAAQSKEENVP